jgi:hypothetical protein
VPTSASDELCDELRRIERELAGQLVRFYHAGVDFEAFWDMVERVSRFAELRERLCGKTT